MRFDITVVRTAVSWDVNPRVFVNTRSYFKVSEECSYPIFPSTRLPSTSDLLPNFLKFILNDLSPISYTVFQVNVFHRFTGQNSVWYLFVPCPAAVTFRIVASGLRDGLKRRAITATQENRKYARREEGSRSDNCCIKIKQKGIQRMPEMD